MSSRQAVQGMSTNEAVDFNFQFASACTVSVVETDNSMVPRVVDCITLLQVDNPEGIGLFLCLSSGKIIKRNLFKLRPMPDTTITYLNNLAFKEIVSNVSTIIDLSKHHFYNKSNNYRHHLYYHHPGQ
jgi:hypothetical protein